MIANYHTHTWRCNHAQGTEEEYVQVAIRRGLKVLGFSDHGPYVYPPEHQSTYRMQPHELPDYASTVFGLRERYREEIDIHLGVETEYYPTYFADTVAMLRDQQVEYMILGQHFLGDGIDEKPCSVQTEDEERLARFCHQVMDAMNTGLFTYVAHPDLIHYVGDPAVYRKHMRQLCREANACGMPLEINLLGVVENRHYPNLLFWETAAEEGCKAVLGCDAHKAEALLDVPSELRALEMAKKFGIEVLPNLSLRRI